MRSFAILFVLSLSLLIRPPAATAADLPATQPEYGRWKNGPSTDPAYFPIAVWLQNPALAPKYQAAGINLYVALWKGPTEKQLTDLASAHMPVICKMNEFAIAHKDDPRFAGTIVGWMHGDEPDNAQEIKDPKTGQTSYGPPIPPAKIASAYNTIIQIDSTRPVLLNLGQCVANDESKNRGPTGKLSDYLGYVNGGDIISFDVYPVANIGKPDGENYLWLVPQGVDRLMKWSDGKKIIWNCIECTHIGNPDRIASPAQVKAEVWMSLIHGSTGLIYFVHEFKPEFNEHALLDNPAMLQAVTAINSQIHDLAPVLNSPGIAGDITVTSSNKDVPIAAMLKRHDEIAYVFAVGTRNGDARATFTIKNLPPTATAQVIGETRTIPIQHGEFSDDFRPYDVHLYSIGK